MKSKIIQQCARHTKWEKGFKPLFSLYSLGHYVEIRYLWGRFIAIKPLEMTEKEKMLRQVLYDANNDTELIEERKVAKNLCYDFNHLRPSDTIGQQRIMRQLLGKTAGDNFCIVTPF